MYLRLRYGLSSSLGLVRPQPKIGVHALISHFQSITAKNLQTDELAVISTSLALFVGVVGLSLFG